MTLPLGPLRLRRLASGLLAGLLLLAACRGPAPSAPAAPQASEVPAAPAASGAPRAARADGTSAPAGASASGRGEARAPASDSERLVADHPEAFRELHYVLHMFGERVGRVRTDGRRDPVTGELHEEFEMDMVTAADGVVSRSHSRERSIYAAGAPHALVFAEQVSIEDGAEERKVYDARGSDARFGVFAGGEAHVRAVERSVEELLPRLTLMDQVAGGATGARGELREYDLDRQSDETATLELLGVETVELAGAPRMLRRVRQSVPEVGETLDVFLDEDDLPVLIRVGELIEARLASEEEALVPCEPVDVLVTGSVPLEGFSGDPAELRALELEWYGPKELLPERAGQSARWNETGDAQIVRLERARRPTRAESKAAVPDDVRRELEPDSTCNSDHPRIRELAQEIAGELDDPWRRVRAIVDWLAENVEGSYAANRSTALAVLEAGAGDCTEFSVLASGLLRAAGVPARRVGGVVLADFDGEELVGHMWVEVWVGRWIPIDPAFGQVPAAPGHVCFGGEREVRFVGTRGMRARVRR